MANTAASDEKLQPMQTLNLPKKGSINEANVEDAESDKMSVVSERSDV